LTDTGRHVHCRDEFARGVKHRRAEVAGALVVSGKSAESVIEWAASIRGGFPHIWFQDTGFLLVDMSKPLGQFTLRKKTHQRLDKYPSRTVFAAGNDTLMLLKGIDAREAIRSGRD
jgi:hypothetical protein